MLSRPSWGPQVPRLRFPLPLRSAMTDSLGSLTADELLALTLDASRRGDTGHALAYLKEAATRPDASAQGLFMLGSEYAQIGLMTEAKVAMSRAVTLGPDFPIARFQLGMLHVTSGDTAQAKAVWAPLATLGESHSQGYLADFHRGMLHLVADEFDAALAALGQGLARNRENEPLNADMRRVMDAIEHLPGRSSAAAASVESPAPGTPAIELPASNSSEAGAIDDEPAHLFINAYTHRGKPH